MTRQQLCTLPVALVMSMGLVGATSIRPVNLEELVQTSDRVFVGTVLEIRHKPGPGGLPTRVTRFGVTEMVKGQLGKSRQIDLAQIWTGSNRQQGVSPLPQPGFFPGEEVLVFLHGDSPLGLSSPVGFGLGKLSVESVVGGRVVRLTPEQQAILLRGLTADDEARLGISPGRRISETIPLEKLVGWLKSRGEVSR